MLHPRALGDGGGVGRHDHAVRGRQEDVVRHALHHLAELHDQPALDVRHLLFARSLLALLEECNPDASNARASYHPPVLRDRLPAHQQLQAVRVIVAEDRLTN